MDVAVDWTRASAALDATAAPPALAVVILLAHLPPRLALAL
jgi:hypothetical protein